MSTLRLSDHTRSKIRSRIMDHAFSGREEALMKQEHALGKAIYRDIYSKKEQDAMAALPDGFLPKEDYVRTSFEGVERWSVVHMGEAKRVAYTHISNPAKVYEAGHRFTVEYAAITKARASLQREQLQKRAEINGVLTGATTLKRLLEAWPEIESFVADLKPSSEPVAIVKVPTELNRALGLPPNTKKNAA